MMAKVYFLIGGNLGDREQILQDTIEALRNDVGTVVTDSSIYETEPWGFNHEQSFLNQVAPLYEIANDLKHPVNGKTIEELKDNCPDASDVKVFKA